MKKYFSQKLIIILKEIKYNKKSEIKNLKVENAKLMRLTVDQALDIQALRRY